MNSELLELNTTTEDTLVIIREFKAPQNLVYDIMTQADHIAKWQIPENMVADTIETDLVVGGKYSIGMKSPDKGFTFQLFGEYTEIDPPNKIVFTQNVPGMEGMTEISISFYQDGDMTQMVFKQSGIATKVMRDHGLNGWAPVFTQLETYISSL